MQECVTHIRNSNRVGPVQRSSVATTFERVGAIDPERDGSGRIIEVRPQTNQPLHKYGGGPFCRFRIAQGSNWQQSGVYVLTLNGVAHYIGECKNLCDDLGARRSYRTTGGPNRRAADLLPAEHADTRGGETGVGNRSVVPSS